MGEETRDLVIRAVDLSEVRDQVATIQTLMRDIMHQDEHYGVIPGTDKPTLYKAGAEKLGFTFRLMPYFDIKRDDLANGHREYEVICTLKHLVSNRDVCQGVGSASTMEGKYRYRNASKTCPECGAEAIVRGKEEYGGGWLCWRKKGGCGAKYQDNDTKIVAQAAGKVENVDIADTYNTVLKMAKKRAHVDAMITACAASDIFTQDLEDAAPPPEVDPAPRAPSPPAAAEKPKPAPKPAADTARTDALDALGEVMSAPVFDDKDKADARTSCKGADAKAITALVKGWTVVRDKRRKQASAEPDDHADEQGEIF